jgi:hypothetical protein
MVDGSIGLSLRKQIEPDVAMRLGAFVIIGDQGE